MQFCELDGYVISAGAGRCQSCGMVLCGMHWGAPVSEYPTVRENQAYAAAAEKPTGAVCMECRERLGRAAVEALPPVVIPTEPLRLLAYGRFDPDARLAQLLPADLRPLMQVLVPFARDEMRPTAHKRATGHYPAIFDDTTSGLHGLLLRADYKQYRRTGLHSYDMDDHVGVGPYYYEIAGTDGLVYECIRSWGDSWQIESSRHPTQDDVFVSMRLIESETWQRLLDGN